MKRFILFILTIALLGGIGYTGYVIFSSKNISKVEIEGNVQTIYLLNETDTPDFQDAKLKITYKSGDVKYLDMATIGEKITVDNFTTSLEASETMKITYKSQLITIDYKVIKSGLYYMSFKESTTSTGSKSTQRYTISKTQNFYNLGEDGVLKYYHYDGNKGKWFLYDGKYLKNYKYEIVNDKVNIYLGSDKPSYGLQAEAVNGEIVVTSTNYLYDGEFQTGKNVFGFTQYQMKDNIEITSAKLYSDNFITNTDVSSEEYLSFVAGDNLDTSSNRLYIKVNYSSPLIYTASASNPTQMINMLGEVYVVLDNSMTNNTLMTALVRPYISTCYVYYETWTLPFSYIVVP
ncbi:MAG: hypothetical protein IJX17_02190 [Clostridia bacterium]|nr:hypothetical protein [Clostridia bacterium]